MPDAMPESRLERATREMPLTISELAAYMDAHGIPYVTDFRAKTLPTPALARAFETAYALRPFERIGPLNTTQQGASGIVVFEHRNLSDSYHGEVNATIAESAGKALNPCVEAIYVDAPMNRTVGYEGDDNKIRTIQSLLIDKGIPVMVNSVGFEDPQFSFRKKGREAQLYLKQTTAFVVDSAGNDGTGNRWYMNSTPHQKHNASSHYPPLVVHVGAASEQLDGEGRPTGNFSVDGYSSANSPTLLAPVAASKYMRWGKDKAPEVVLGTSASAPYVGGVLGALNATFGPYLTREQMLYAVLATAKPIIPVTPFSNKTNTPLDLIYRPNARGMQFNASYGGFGLIQPENAYRLLAQMVKLTQQDPSRITTPIETIVGIESKDDQSVERDHEGNYVYRLRMPKGTALKTMLEVGFGNEYGKIQVISPTGTSFPMVLSRSVNEEIRPTNGDKSKPSYHYDFSRDDEFGIGTSHAWAGEQLGGEWIIRSTTPIRKLEMSQHHFRERDIVQDIHVGRLLAEPLPDLSYATSIKDMGERRYAAPQLFIQVPAQHQSVGYASAMQMQQGQYR